VTPTRFVFLEGIMGAGKTTTAQWLAAELAGRGVAARFLAEGPTVEEPEHPLRLGPTLPHPHAPWLDVAPEEYLRLSLGRWRTFAAEAALAPGVTLCDGLLFHGNLTDLLLMDAPSAVLDGYVGGVLDALAALGPSVVYLRPPDLDGALRAVSAARGPAWVAYQVDWKLGGPHACRRGLTGYAGLVELYRGYRALCDRAFDSLAAPKLAVATAGDWSRHRREILAFLDVAVP
jgi:hypothetical protein